MGYSELPDGAPSTKKFTVSLWLRVPTDAIAAAVAESAAWFSSGGASADRPPMTGIIPVMTLGPTSRAKKLAFDAHKLVGIQPSLTQIRCTSEGWVVDSFTPGQDLFTDSAPRLTDELYLRDASYIGVDCNGKYPTLAVNIVMPSTPLATILGTLPDGASYDAPSNVNQYFNVGLGPCSNPSGYHLGPLSNTGHPLDNPLCVDSVASYTLSTVEFDEGGTEIQLQFRPENFRTHPALLASDQPDNGVMGSTPVGSRDPGAVTFGYRIVADHWHHVLLSFDCTETVRSRGILMDGHVPLDYGLTNYFNAGSRVSGTAKMYLAVDDTNLTDSDLSVYWPTGYSNKNGILTVNGYYTCTTVNNNITDTIEDCLGNTTTNSIRSLLSTYSYSPPSIPLSAASVNFPASSDYVSGIKHVELAIAQIFTDVVVDTGVVTTRRGFITKDGRPAPLKDAEVLMGKKPEILLNKASDWQKARNAGTYPGTVPAQEGVHVGDIRVYRPGPSLHGKQS